MKKQNYKNHPHFYIAHHLIFYPILLLLTIIACWYGWHYRDERTVFGLITITLLMMGFMATMMRQHYGLKLQDRIIELEVAVRYFEMTGKRFSMIENKLSFSQIAALRFASDEEFIGLIDKSIKENTSAKYIKNLSYNGKLITKEYKKILQKRKNLLIKFLLI